MDFHNTLWRDGFLLCWPVSLPRGLHRIGRNTCGALRAWRFAQECRTDKFYRHWQPVYRFLVLLLFPGVQQLIVSSLQLTDQTSVGRRDFIGRTILHQIHDLIFQKFLFSFVCRSQTWVGVEGKQDFIVNDRNSVLFAGVNLIFFEFSYRETIFQIKSAPSNGWCWWKARFRYPCFPRKNLGFFTLVP